MVKAKAIYSTFGVYYLVFLDDKFIESCDENELNEVLKRLNKYKNKA